MAPSNLPVSGPGYRTTSWSVHNGLLQDVEEQSVVGTSDSSLNLENDVEVRASPTFLVGLEDHTAQGHQDPILDMSSVSAA